MKWIVSLVTIVVLLVFIIIAFTRHAGKERNPAILLMIALLIYHVGDCGLWYGYDYELVRRIASVGFYFIMPFSLWLMYLLVPKEKMNLLIRIITLVLILPWIYALVAVKDSPLVFLQDHVLVPDEAYENFIMGLVLLFTLGTIFAAIVGFRAAKFREDYGKKLAKNFSWGLIIYNVLILCLFMSIDAFGYDATWWFGVPATIYALLILLGLNYCCCEEKAEA
jgi:hypothetical protein